ncbi:hypothetical protein FBU30_003419 [Linnemannia zychae]|nr:hypothetical protein FBU30_003419 [Linnemannia zychae]
MSLYIDGHQAEEKSSTTADRERKREQASELTIVALDTLESRLDNDNRNKGWTVKVADTEADLAIAIDADPDNIIISSDSDMMAYATVHTLWRLVSGGVILVYNIPDLLGALDITRAQLTALAVVSRNDYNKNVRSLGPATNFSIIKFIKHDAKSYLKTPAARIFQAQSGCLWILNQTKVETDESLPGSQILFEQLQDRFREICKRYDERKQHQPRGAQLR